MGEKIYENVDSLIYRILTVYSSLLFVQHPVFINSGPLFLELNSEIKLGESADITSEQS